MKNLNLLMSNFYKIISLCKKDKFFGYLLVLILLQHMSVAEVRADSNQKETIEITNGRLRIDERLIPEVYSIKPPQSLDDAVIEYKSKLDKTDLKLLQIDVRKALESIKNPEKVDVENKVSTSNELTISDVRVKALKNNLMITVAQIDPLIAATEVREEEAKFDNIFFAYAKYKESITPKSSSDRVEFKSDNLSLDEQQLKLQLLEQDKSVLDIEAGIKIPLRTGGSVSISSPLENKISRGKFGSDEYRSALRFSISQPLLRNAGVDTNEASIRIAEYSQQAVQLKTRLQTIRIIATIDKAYWALYQAWSQLDVRRQQFEYANQNLTMVKLRVREGLTAAIEVNRAEIGVADRMDALIVSETTLKLAQRQLQFYMNDLSEKYSIDKPLIPITKPSLLKYEFNRQKLLEDALFGRIELLEQELKLAADSTKIDYLENQTLPMFTLDYQYGALSDTNNSFGSNFRNLANGEFNDWSIGFKFEMPFTNEARKAKLENAIQQRNQRLATKSLQKLTVEREIYDALDYVDQNWQRILTARQQVLIAGINYEAELKQFKEGIRTMTEVLESLTRLGEAQLKEVHAITEYQISLVDTAYATGTLLGYSKLDFNEGHESTLH